MTDMTLSLLDGTHEEAGLRRLIRQYAHSQEGYDARLYDLWDEWNDEFFEGRMVPSLIQLTDPGQTQCYGCCTTFSGLAGIHSAIKIRRSILDGTLRDLKHGNRDPQGLRRFLEDVLLHEMVHQWHHEVTGETDPPDYRGHGPAFSAKVNEIGAALGLPRVGRTRMKRDHADKGLESPQHWPHNVRPEGYYLGAHVPSSTDKPPGVFLPLDIEQAIPLLREHFDAEELCRRLGEPAKVAGIKKAGQMEYIVKWSDGTGSTINRQSLLTHHDYEKCEHCRGYGVERGD